MTRNFQHLLTSRWERANSLLCISLDTDMEKIPKHLHKNDDPLYEFNKEIIDATHDLVCAYKPNMAFYEAVGIDGFVALKKTVNYLLETHPDIPIICDAKRGDVGNTSEKYAEAIFDYFNFDAATINIYGGYDSVKPFVKRADKGVILWCRSSNPSASDFQNIVSKETGLYLYHQVALKAKVWNTNQNIGLVIGATYPQEMNALRETVGDEIFFLVPGLGAQGGKPEDLVNGFTSTKTGLIANSARGIIYASMEEDFAQAARTEAIHLRDEINTYR